MGNMVLNTAKHGSYLSLFVCSVLCVFVSLVHHIMTQICSFNDVQEDSRVLRVKVIAGIGLAKKDILGAR